MQGIQEVQTNENVNGKQKFTTTRKKEWGNKQGKASVLRCPIQTIRKEHKIQYWFVKVSLGIRIIYASSLEFVMSLFYFFFQYKKR